MIFRSIGATVAVAAAIVTALAVSPAAAATLKVDDDGVQCPGAYPTLQAAVAAAAAGDKIKVCPGSYGGQVTISVPLKIFGKAPKPKTCNTLAPLDPTLHSIFTPPGVPGLGGIGIDVLADAVTIQGMVFTGAGETAVRTDPANVKFSLKNSVFTSNANGVYFHSAVGSKSSVKGNCFHQNGTGVRTGYGLRDASIAKNYFFKSNVAAGIIMDQLSAATNDRIKITGNRSESDVTFAVILGTLDSSFSKNKVNSDGTTGTAVFVGGKNTNLVITGNTVTNAGTRAIRFNTQFFPGFPPGGASTGVTVTKNVIDKAGSHGIAVDSGAGESALVASTIVKNTVTDSGQDGAGDGIRIVDFMAMGANGGNTVEDNEVSGSFNHDCHDTTTGAGTAGTASTWVGNTATTHNVANLCFTGAANGVAD
ncbi:MAG: right-handed parallel beta-helix repeat-containing protein [Deltaproteobacteria bacterium]|nr:right-handed parallel beta-helix repeat-containing protein [Deltaproteobacteria bacterium]